MGNIRELKTNRSISKDHMIEYLEDMLKKVKEDSVESLVLIFSNTEGVIQSQVIGDISFVEAIGMIDGAKFALHVSQFFGSDDDG